MTQQSGLPSHMVNDVQVVTTVHTFVMSLLAMPHKPSDHAIATKVSLPHVLLLHSHAFQCVCANGPCFASCSRPNALLYY